MDPIRFVLGAALALALAPSLAAGAGVRTYRNEAMGVRAFEPPAGWELAPQASYPRLLASYSHREGGRLTLSAQRLPAGVTAAKLAQQARGPMEKQGYRSIKVQADGERVRLEAELDGGRRVVRQLYVVAGEIGYVVTLVAPKSALAHLGGDFEEAVKSLEVGATPAE